MRDLHTSLKRFKGISRETRELLSQIKCLSNMDDEDLCDLAIYFQTYVAARRGELGTKPTAAKEKQLNELITALSKASVLLRDAHPDLQYNLAIEMRIAASSVSLIDLKHWLTSAELAAESILGKLRPRVKKAPKKSFARLHFYEHMDCLWQTMKDASRPHPPRSTVVTLLNQLLERKLKLSHGGPASLEAAAKVARKNRQ